MKISVIIRSHNDESVIRRTLEGICSQKTDAELELLSFDDASTDGTLSIIREFPQVKIIPHDGLPYNPPRVLNRAVATATGDILVFNNSDAVPLHDDYIEQLIKPLSDISVGLTFANQLSREDAFVLVRKDNLRAFGDGHIASTWRHMYSIVSSACRMEVAKNFSFDPAFQYSEDIDWSFRIKKSGLKIIYVPDAQVEHSHNYTVPQLKKRFYNEGWANGQLFREKPSFVRTFFSTGKEILRDMAFMAKEGELHHIFQGLRYRFVQRYSTYRGERDYCRRENIS